MDITVETVGRRHYFRGNTFPIKDLLRAFGSNWDADKRVWWTGQASVAERILAWVARDRDARTVAAPATPQALVAPTPIRQKRHGEEEELRHLERCRENILGECEYQGCINYIVKIIYRTSDAEGIIVLRLMPTDGSFMSRAVMRAKEFDRVAKMYCAPMSLDDLRANTKKDA